MLDALACGRAFRTFNITDYFNCEIIHIEVETSSHSFRATLLRGTAQTTRYSTVTVIQSETAAAWGADEAEPAVNSTATR